jgi:hypothetical protein
MEMVNSSDESSLSELRGVTAWPTLRFTLRSVRFGINWNLKPGFYGPELFLLVIRISSNSAAGSRDVMKRLQNTSQPHC